MDLRSPALILAGRYRLAERIAAGGVGEVWRGTDAVLGRPVAVKLLRAEYAQHPETLARFRAEARHAGAVSHPGIAQVYDYGEDGQPYLVMELVNGPSLAGLLAREPLDAATAMDVAAAAATALAAAHAAGLVHRDIKPANLLLGPDGQVKITDFGIAYAAGSAPLTRTGTLIGTPAYLAPERAAGKAATPASDLYSLGIVCYECLTGTPPFTGTPMEVTLAHQHGDLPPLGDQVPAEVAAFVASLTAKDPAARPASADEAARWAASIRDALAGPDAGRAVPPVTALTQPLPGTLIGAPPEILPDAAGPTAPPPPGRRRRWLLAGGAAAAVAALASLLIAGGLGTASPPPHQAGGTPSPSVPRMVEVSQAALAGQPVRDVRRRLTELGLHVVVVWRGNGHQPPGTVISVQPAGRLPVGTAVTVTGALAPPGHGPGKDKGGKGKDTGHGKGG